MAPPIDSRRTLLKALVTAGSGAVAASHLPARWTKPIVDSVVVPVHAQSTGVATTVFSSSFESGMPAGLSPGVATLTGVQGFAGLGPPGNQFGGNFLRSPTGNPVTLTLTGLPVHTRLSIEFLFAAIDSLDGTGAFPAGDFFNITVDGVSVFRESFANATPDQIQSYVPAPGVELARRVDLGFEGPGGFFTDSAYNMALEPRLQNVPHSASTATIVFLLEGAGVQPLNDESWAVDNLSVKVSP